MFKMSASKWRKLNIISNFPLRLILFERRANEIRLIWTNNLVMTMDCVHDQIQCIFRPSLAIYQTLAVYLTGLIFLVLQIWAICLLWIHDFCLRNETSRKKHELNKWRQKDIKPEWRRKESKQESTEIEKQVIGTIDRDKESQTRERRWKKKLLKVFECDPLVVAAWCILFFLKHS